jgi:hypothetical protein
MAMVDAPSAARMAEFIYLSWRTDGRVEHAAGDAADGEGADRHGESDSQAEEPLSGRSLLVATFSTT